MAKQSTTCRVHIKREYLSRRRSKAVYIMCRSRPFAAQTILALGLTDGQRKASDSALIGRDMTEGSIMWLVCDRCRSQGKDAHFVVSRVE